jgi:hypothetical protein
MSEAEKPGFLARWSRRKLEAKEAVPEPPAMPEAEAAEAPQAPPALPRQAPCPIPGMEAPDLASLPPIEELTLESDISGFLRPGVPAALRGAALRRIWSLDPAIRDFIGCVDYQWDFNTPGGLPHGFAAELGGEVRKLLAQAIGQRDPEETPQDDAGAEPGAGQAETPEAAPPEPPPAIAEDPPPPEPPMVLAEPEPEPAPAPRRRHGGALPA